MLEERLSKLYDQFKGLPSQSPIVRNNQRNDAFVVLTSEILFNKDDSDRKQFDVDDLTYLTSFVVPPPDNGIDIFYEEEDCDEAYYHIVQVKNTSLAPHEIESCFAVMKRVIKSYLKDSKLVNDNLKSIISNTKFSTNYLENCTYYVVHAGDLNYTRQLRKDEKIITKTDLETLASSLPDFCVPKEILGADMFNNFLLYHHESDKSNENKKPDAYMCNLNGYDLARLSNKYSSTEVGRNILFGQNLRDSLAKKSKTYESMFKTIDEEPEMFWYYNNGISIIAEIISMETISDETVGSDQEFAVLKKFSIVNGAQTTSTLGAYLREAEINNQKDKIEKLKQVHVLARMVEIKKNKKLRQDIAIYNNTQNPISSRDMVSNKEEQIYLNEWLAKGDEPRIFVEIRRGSKRPSNHYFYPHRIITNEVLAQYAYSAFLKSPYKAKDKKKTLFNKDASESEWTLNEDYHKIFNISEKDSAKGVLFKKNKHEIDELLFIAYLHKDANKYLRLTYKERVENLMLKMEATSDQDDKETLQGKILRLNRLIEISNVCLFYNIALYYELKSEFDINEMSNKVFKFNEYYSDKDYRHSLITLFVKLFLERTIEIIRNRSEDSNVTNWIRSQKNEKIFMDTLRDNLALKTDYNDEYREFINKMKR